MDDPPCHAAFPPAPSGSGIDKESGGVMDYDVVVVGGGPAGLAFARGLARASQRGRPLKVAIVERQPREALAQPAFDGREIALTHRSIDTLKALGAWEHIPQNEVAPLREARVLNGASPFALAFDPRGGVHDRLGTLVPNHLIRRALFEVTAGQEGLDLLTGASITALGADDSGAHVVLADGRRLAAPLLVGADSRFSFVREQLGIPAQINRTGRSMLCCRVHHEADHDSIATEWFDHGETKAILPLNGRMASAVLTLASEEIDRLCAMDPATLGAELTRRFDGRLGQMRVAQAPHAYPLATTWSRHFASTSAALIGDAAVGMHPVTAHGFNLGLRSAASLAALVVRAHGLGRPLASPLLLRRYEAGQRLAARPLYDGTNLLVNLFTAETPPARLARSASLRLAARLPGLRGGVSRLLLQR